MGLRNLVSKYFSSDKKAVGSHHEHKACRYLEGQGLRLITKNFRCSLGEIDLIMQDAEFLVFVEVRYRSHPQRLSSLDSVDYYKQQRLSRTAQYYLQKNHASEKPCRFDVLGFDEEKMTWVKGAF